MKQKNSLQNSIKLLFVEKDEHLFLQADAFNHLYQSTHLSVFRYVYGLTGGPPAEVEDITAEAFFRAWKNREKFSGSFQEGTGWVLRIARNLVIDGYRQDKNRMPYEDELPEDEYLQLPAENLPEEEIIQSEQQDLILRLIKNLPPDQREMLVLRYFLNWKIRQIGAYLNIPENTVSVSVRRSLEKIRSQWPAEKEINQ